MLLLLGLFAWTIRLALRERGAGGWALATLTLWVVMGIPAVLDHDDSAHGHPLPLTEPQMAVGTGIAMTSGGDGSEVAGVLCGLPALGYHAIAAAVGVVREQTGLTQAELAIQVGLPPVALALWERGSLIPAPTPAAAGNGARRRPPGAGPARHHGPTGPGTHHRR